MAEIEVIDNGTGLPRHNRTKLLEPYVTTKGSKGTGLGLAIVQKIVEQHGGTLALEDAPNDAGSNARRARADFAARARGAERSPQVNENARTLAAAPEATVN